MTKKTLRNKCDRVVGAKVRELGYCEICGSTENLQWVHFISRGVIKLRYEKKNNGCVCASCHKLGHNSPHWMTVQWNRIKGDGTTHWLELEQHKLKPITEEFYLNILNL
jgi:hypothetical protein